MNSCPDCNEAHDAETIAEAINHGGYHAYLVFPENFDRDIASYDPASGLAAPEVKIYYNSSDADSQAA